MTEKQSKIVLPNTKISLIDEDGKEFDLTFAGDLTTYYTNEKVKEIIPLLKGVVVGTFKSFYENGNRVFFNG